ncbi:MAG: hypothetical protein J6Q57_02280 [Paraprevotella sp.]|nr:hypothetical protein [Paraprevotella sp.]
MASMKIVPISHDEYLSGKWQSVSSSSGKHEAKVFYKDDGSIDECSYSDSYCRKHQLGRYAPKAASSSSKSSSSKSSSGKSGSKIAPIPFLSKSSKRKPNIFDEDYEEEDNDNEEEPEMENEIRVRAEIEDGRKREFIEKIESYVDGGEDITTEMIEEVRSLAIENGYSPTEAEITLKNAQRKQDPERVYADEYQGPYRKFSDFLKYYHVPRNREYLIKYINMILITKDGIDDMSDETLENIKKVVNIKFRNDSEIQALFKELRAKKRKKERLFLAIPIIAMIIMLIMAIILNA